MPNKKNIKNIIIIVLALILAALIAFTAFYSFKQKPKPENKRPASARPSEQELRINIQRQELKQLREKRKVKNNSDAQIENQRKALERLRNQN